MQSYGCSSIKKEIKSQAAKGPEVQDSCQEKENVRNELNFEIYYVLSSIPFSLHYCCLAQALLFSQAASKLKEKERLTAAQK